MKRLSYKNLLLIGLTLFSMFFGAGNLIFPPFLGAQAGVETWVAMAGFAVTAIGFPILGVAAVAKAGGLPALAGRVHPRFAFVFTLLIYLSIGPCLAIPRTASTSFEMAVIPFLGQENYTGIAQVLYSCLFFGIAYLLAMHPEKLKDRLGKILTPCLLTLIVVIFLGCIIGNVGSYGLPSGPYTGNSFIQGFLDGYQTMDTIAALNFGIIISINIQAMGIKEDHSVVSATIKAGFIAGVLLLAVYAALAHVGAITGGTYGVLENGARTLTTIVRSLFGNGGMVILAAIFFIACLNTCVGLLSCCSEYFCTLMPKVEYRKWVGIFVAASLVVSNVGLNRILEFSVPVLNAIYPVAIVLIALSFLPDFIGKSVPVYRSVILLTAVTSVAAALAATGVRIPVLTAVVEFLPFYDISLGWLIPSAAGLMVGLIISSVIRKRRS